MKSTCLKKLLSLTLFAAGLTVRGGDDPGPAVPHADLAKARSQYVAGEPQMAAQTLARILEHQPENEEALALLRRIAAAHVDGNTGRTLTTAQLLNEVMRAWQRPAGGRKTPQDRTETPNAVAEKIDRIVLPVVNFSGVEFDQVVAALALAAEEFDSAVPESDRGLNLVLADPAGTNPPVRVMLRDLPLRRVLDLVTSSVGYEYEVQEDAVLIRPAGAASALTTRFHPVSRSTVLRMTGRGVQPGAPPVAVEEEGRQIREFLQRAGVDFVGLPGSSLAFDGSQLIVSQTGGNQTRIRNILARYREVRQVEIEAKFMEVQDGALEELGINWNVGKKPTQRSGATLSTYQTANRSLSGAFSGNVGGTQGAIVRPAVPDSSAEGGSAAGQEGLNLPILSLPPPIPGTNNLGLGAAPLATVTGILGEFNVNAVIRALSQRSGTELLSAPKLTVLSGSAATITVAQELRYPQSYGQVQSQVGTGNASGGGSAGVAITAGTPQEFATRNIGVELRVTPTVEEDDHSISLDLNPKVTEFEGFVEYGGQSIAISGSTTVTVPSGFYQPIFAVREVSTRVTIWDGATIVMGGLTREDTRKTNDKVPVLGNVPVLGRLFRSAGESAQKRNLLIFVTASLVNPGGALRHQPGGGGEDLFRNPSIVTPAGLGARR